ncbi:uncharacterized protein SPAPADRAFT_47834 [Spathaspora passalidarum NRRL Y-27907]|uniref:Spindle pole body component Bbp1 C-terminal domain-containing protein n=1 Tax=Spathaspora passalidarum (strain NRRL Y-27907 / 11-Y1) TaxID=619300 RepID=G3AEI8_SPAPN|nr:uncharacterized protein SPAPADRAFT_47834 [Spathaspora passalidarum NRRL Y-27907]EGW34750.1 hypothetical protein SPAPADRAFT_47834 [Spathaspora passalidarum NRRL Y-27907]
MIKYLFGVGEDDSRPLVDEPTIDYNETIHSSTPSSQGNLRQTRKSILKDTTGSSHNNPDIPVIGDLSDSELDYDDDLIHDINLVREVTQTLSSGYDGLGNHATRISIPDDYPGKYPRSRERTSNLSEQKNDPNWDIRASKGGRTSNYSKSYESTEQVYESTIDRKLDQLRIEVDNELKNYKNKPSTGNDDTTSQLRELNTRLKARTQYLSKLSQLTKAYNEEQNESTIVPPDIMEKYDNMKTEYLEELHRTQTLYLAYYRLLEKHLQFRKTKSTKNDVTVSKSATKSVIPMREKIKLIQSKTSDSTIKNLCGNVLSDVNKWEQDRDSLLKEKEQLQKDLRQMKSEKEALQLKLNNKESK